MLKFSIGVVMMNLVFVLVFLIRHFIYIGGIIMEVTNKFVLEKMLVVLRILKFINCKKVKKLYKTQSFYSFSSPKKYKVLNFYSTVIVKSKSHFNI